ncbi:MAG: hypothetical protein C4325_14085 [Blastocatellia bacterium]
MKSVVTICSILRAEILFTETSLMPKEMTCSSNSSAQTVSGKELSLNNCARCHGDTGEAGKGPNLTTAKKQAKWKDSDEKLVKKITGGVFRMPKFGKRLKPEEIKAIASFVRSLNAG